ncbi:TPA: hypothetical protein EYN65_17150 [Candidatus Poribacteria bacterium]|jgi:hypothetical protein|nr:hypothetical protein [Candidatus Poribacteria bacterium]HIC03737.1 hypothetical protein [Candidatus Poribacteria bacterium]HIN27556.1 hypothetical protein [Candidatus Poribacteria bacterium]HIO77619.1 hypothetical protein [Candidatus Poribacteria bacterium]
MQKFRCSIACKFSLVLLFLSASLISHALTYDFVGKDAQKWFDEFIKSADTTESGDAGWHLTANGLETNDNVGTGHQRIGIKKDWTDYTLESKYQYVKQGAHKEAHLYIRWKGEKDNYFFRTIGRKNGGGAGSGYSIEWLRKVGGKDNEGDLTKDGDDIKILGKLQDKTLYGLRGEIKGESLKVDFFKDNKWIPINEVKYPGTHKTGGIGVGRATAQVAWQYLKVNGPGIPKDATTPVEALNRLATTWGKLKRP